MADHVLLWIVAVPLGLTVLNMLLPSILRKIFTFIGLGFTFYLALSVFFGNATPVTCCGFQLFAIDKLGLFSLLAIEFLSLVILIFALNGVDEKISRSFYVLYPLTVASCAGVVLSHHVLSFIIFWGISGLTLYLFNLLGKEEGTSSSAKKTLLIIGGTDAFLILGFLLMYTSRPITTWTLTNINLPLIDGVAILAFISLLTASLAKAGGFPLHTWVPSFASKAPIESVAFLPASLDKILGIYLLARIVTNLFQASVIIHLILITIGSITVISAVMMALIQHNGRTLLGYHAVSQVGYMIMGVGSGSPIAFAGGLFHMVNHTIYKSNLFLSLGSVEKKTGTHNLDDLGGLGTKMPITMIMALIGAFSISGIPPFNGFFSKWLIYQGILEKAKELSVGYEIWLLICLILAVFGSVLTLASFLKYLHTIFLGKRPQKYDKITEAPFNQWLSTGILSIFCVGFGLFAMAIPLKKFILPILEENHIHGFEQLGSYNPVLVTIMMAIAFLTGLIVYLCNRNVRVDDVYLGGMDPLEKFRVSGTEFYNEIRQMKPLKSIYDAAEKKVLDLYELLSKGTLGLSKVLQVVHTGQLQLYLLFILIGVFIFITQR